MKWEKMIKNVCKGNNQEKYEQKNNLLIKRL
jgi:hypothetical protein